MRRRIRRVSCASPLPREGCTAVTGSCTAVQLSRGKGEAQLIFEIALLMQDLSRFAADVLLFSTREFGFLALAEEFTTGSSIMPQKRSEERRVGKECGGRRWA